jgi:RNA 3'-terminal phosphate cyclase (ATP)
VAAVRAAAALGTADHSPVAVGTESLQFEPGTIVPGAYQFDVGTVGSAVLVLQTLLPAILTAPRPSRVSVTGGTHAQSAPPYEFFASAYLPLLERLGPTLHPHLDTPGFYPEGGGRCGVEVDPVEALRPLDLRARGRLRRARARAIVAHLPRHIGERELATLREAVPLSLHEARIETPDAAGAGNALVLELAFQHVTTVISAIGQKGWPAERVAQAVARDARSYLAADAPVGPHLADQLLVPLALSGGRFWTTTLTPHFHTNAAVIEAVVGECFTVEAAASGWTVAAEAVL